MLEIRRGHERGRFELDWLDSKHSFSFGSYYDPRHMGFRSLRVINEDSVAPSGGFPPHGHRDMEILSYVVAGALEHRDSMRNGSVVPAGELQYMRAGTGVMHSEYNVSNSDALKFLQIWIVPNRRGSAPAYDQRKIDEAKRHNRLLLLASGDARDDAVHVQQDVRLYTAKLEPNATLSYELEPGRGAWVQVVSGELEANAERLSAGDGAAIEDVQKLSFRGTSGVEFLLFDLGA